MRETKNVGSYYQSVAALDYTVPEIDTGTGYYIPPGNLDGANTQNIIDILCGAGRVNI